MNKRGELLPRKERLKLQQLLEKERSIYIELIKQGVATESDRQKFMDVDRQAEQARRINECEFDVAQFAIEYFSDDANPENDENLIPSGVDLNTMSTFHKELCGLLSDITVGKKKSNVAWACPRQHAKTAYGSNIFPIHQAVYKHKRFIVVVSETSDMASAFITWGNHQLKSNDKLITDFGRLLHEKPSMNATDNKDEYVTLNNVKIMARGAGRQIRGMRFGKLRPELLILDDLEGQEHVSTSDQMEKMRKWFDEDALPAMDRKGMCLYLGTILCYDSLLDKVVRERGDFESRRYKAINKFADNDYLWEEWKRIYLSDTADRSVRALQFFEDNEKEMLEGTELLWGEYWTYYEFIEKLVNIGPKSFNQEYQNEPTDEERQIFKPEDFMYYSVEDIERIPYEDREYYAGVDFAMGKEKGDFSVIATILKNKQTGRAYIIDIYEKRIHPNGFLDDVVDHVIKYQYESIAVESQMAQEFFTDHLIEKLIEKGYPAHSRVVKVKQRTRKQLRIEAMQPDILNGNLRFNKAHNTLINQFAMYPMGRHDDMIDGVEMGYRALQKHQQSTIKTVRNTRGHTPNMRGSFNFGRRYG